jgi:hypothetical protein
VAQIVRNSRQAEFRPNPLAPSCLFKGRCTVGKLVAALAMAGFLLAPPAAAGVFFFSTGNPDGLIGTLSRPASLGLLQTETADDFVLTQTTSINQATFFALPTLRTRRR